MAYSELIKNFDRIRAYMREFYVYGFKSREDYTEKSARSYDDERRRIESWLGGYMGFRRTAEGKNVFLSIDSRASRHNPLYQAWKAKSFTDGDITLHFLLFDILSSPDTSLSLWEIIAQIDARLRRFDKPKTIDESTVRKKIKEYTDAGLLRAEKQGRTVRYRRTDDVPFPCTDALDFFSETAPCGVIGSFLLDKAARHKDAFAFKHHYITQALDSDVLCSLFNAICEKRGVILEMRSADGEKHSQTHGVPLRIYISVQSGRQYVMAYIPRQRKIQAIRLDKVSAVRIHTVCDRFEEYRARLDAMKPHIWGVSTHGASGAAIEHIDFTIRYSDSEDYIRDRLEREKRCGMVERLDTNTSRFSAEVYNAGELIPWIRTFLCRIIDFHCSVPALERRFLCDLEQMYQMYGLSGEEADE